MTCPKCHGRMRQFERSGVHIDQCTECRGIFLDRGELEHLIDAENRLNAPPPPRPAASPAPPPPPAAPYPPQYAPAPPPPHAAPYGGYGHGQPHYKHGHAHYKHGHYGHGYKRKSIFRELFD
ncbi:hypothetical protein Afil01_19710 [Actinorhabdospora filicis]|uniref:Transcription factor zinc-finger domain-containing protein n=2 Tax=Actinorhabdospora filicis TaxID=1785913 RepID=A0A9W6W830_9ACTN|nr:hypothetical protein Afil01_19710 [Actinorhabdospora filicis]